MAMTLEELKAENAKAEAAAKPENTNEELETEASPQAAEEESETQVDETETAEQAEDAESETEEVAEDESDEWMQSDSHESQAEKKFTDGDIGKAKAKLRAKLEKRHDGEVEKLKQEIESLKGQLTQSSAAKSLQKPKREDFFDSDDPESAYEDALLAWQKADLKAEISAEQAASQTQQQNLSYIRETEKAVDQHYERAIKLAEKSDISAEQYQTADFRVRSMIESLYPNAGDAITDGLIANLGEGSEKVFYNLGVNQARLGELRSRLERDKTGVSAAMYLGQLKAELNSPRKRKTTAPKPSPNLDGDVGKTDEARFKALKKKYDAAHKSGDMQTAFNIRREARKAGALTRDW